MAPILKAYARFKAAKIKEVILNESVLTVNHSSNNNNNNGNKKKSGSDLDEAILQKMAEAQLCGHFNKSHVCNIL